MPEVDLVEICAGAGGQSLGLHLAGFRHRKAIELDFNAAQTLRTNLARLHPQADPSELVAVGDVADEDVWDPAEHRGKTALLAGGVPCPPFSKAGKQLGSSDERDLLAWAVELAGRIEPEAVLLENVRGLNDARFAGYRQAVVDRFAQLGFTAFWDLLEAKDFGVPQLRPRMILVALRPEYVPYFGWPERKPTEETVGTALADLMSVNGFPYIDRWVERANDIAPTIVGGSKKHGGADLGPTRAKRAWEAMWTDAHGVADAAPGEDWRIEDNPRGPKLTTEMVARLQGWNGPEYGWEFTGKKTSRYRQIGNAFPPPVARAVGESIARALRKESVPGHIPPDMKVHDEVYRVLRDSDSWMSIRRIKGLLGGNVQDEYVLDRLEALRGDFVVEERVRGNYTGYRLGEFKAFRGQETHDRRLAFAESKTRRQVS